MKMYEKIVIFHSYVRYVSLPEGRWHTVYFCVLCGQDCGQKLPRLFEISIGPGGWLCAPRGHKGRSLLVCFANLAMLQAISWWCLPWNRVNMFENGCCLPPFHTFSTLFSPRWCKFIPKVWQTHPSRFHQIFCVLQNPRVAPWTKLSARGAFASVPWLCPACCEFGLWHRQWTHHRWLICDLSTCWLCNLMADCDNMSHHVTRIVTKCHQGIWTIASEFRNQPRTLQLFRFLATGSTDRYN